jgi:hypothetical protein
MFTLIAFHFAPSQPPPTTPRPAICSAAKAWLGRVEIWERDKLEGRLAAKQKSQRKISAPLDGQRRRRQYDGKGQSLQTIGLGASSCSSTGGSNRSRRHLSPRQPQVEIWTGRGRAKPWSGSLTTPEPEQTSSGPTAIGE